LPADRARWENRAVAVRRAHVDDAERIAEIHVRSWQRGYQGLIPQAYLDGLDPALRAGRWVQSLAAADWSQGGTLVVADEDGVILGFANAQPSRDEDADTAVAEVTAIYLAPGAYGKGYGRELMTATLEFLAHLGNTQVTLWVLDTNARARRFYEAAGFRADDAVKVDDSRGFPLREVRYRRPLP
jgi:GNAT superfamily N-acetyltransferase